METIDDQSHCELGDIQDGLKAKAKQLGLNEYVWMEAYQNAEQTAIETNNFQEYIEEGYTWIEKFKEIAFYSLDDLFYFYINEKD